MENSEQAHMGRNYDVMAAGHLCLDVIPRFADTGARTLHEILRPGKLVEVHEAKISTGGAVSNTGINLKTLGNKVCFSARVGDDEFGRLTLDFLRAKGNPEGVRVVSGSASSYTVVIAPPNIDRMFLHNPGTNNEYGPEDLQPALIAECRLFHFGYPPLMRRMYEDNGGALREILQKAKECGATTSCDMALPDPQSAAGKAPWHAILENVLPYVDIFLPSVEEAFYMLDPKECLRLKRDHGGSDLIDVLTPDDYGRIADRLLGLGCKMTALKAGHRGFYLKTGPASSFGGMGAAQPGNPEDWSMRELWHPAYSEPNPAGATGSGDASIAGFLTGFLRGLGPEMALSCATCVGWQNLQELDAISGVHDWEYTLDLIAKKMPVVDPRVRAPGWHWSEEHGVWSGPADPLST